MAAGGRGLSIAGIPLHVPWTGVVGVLLIAFLWLPGLEWPGSQPWATYAVALAFAALLYASVLLHELAHAVVARAFGFPVQRIVLWALGGYTVYERRTPTPGREAAIAFAGPASTVLIALAFWAASRVVPQAGPLGVLFESLAFGNALLAAYNLLPGLPLDGGGILRAAVWRLSGRESVGTIASAWAGRAIAVALLLLPFALGYARGSEPSLEAVVVFAIFASFVWIGATNALRQGRLEAAIPRLDVRSLVRRTVAAPRDLPLSEAMRRLGEAQAGGIVVVDHEGSPIAVVQEAAVSVTPLQRRPWIPVSSVARTLEPDAVIRADASGDDLLEALGDRHEVLVVDDGNRVVGIVTSRDVEAALRG